ncbi:MAG: hypothetical protein SNF33_00085 (plasmid) [Candidatus Algichlamydia australiensis]|nr:hypothetical protein [Chlamydiales bacterium]
MRKFFTFLFFTPMICFADQLTHKIIPDDCPYIKGLSKQDSALSFNVEMLYEIANQKSKYRCFDFQLNIPEGEKYRYRVTENEKTLFNEKMKMINGSVCKIKDGQKLSDSLSVMDYDIPGRVVVFEFYNKLLSAPTKKAFIPFCKMSESIKDNACIYYSLTVPTSKAFLIIGEQFLPSEEVEILCFYGDNTSPAVKEETQANKNGRIFSRIYPKGNESRKKQIKIIAKRKGTGEEITLHLKK